MKNKGCMRWGLWLGLLALAFICILAAALTYFQSRASTFHSRPLVLIHSPVNHEQVRVSDGVIVHATARADNGLRRMELWADGVFVDARDVTDGTPSTLVFSGSWVPTAQGNHALIVRAIAADGTEGQATVMVEALPQEGADSGTHTVEEGETLETIAEEYGMPPEELAGANPDIEPGGPVPGDDVVIPDDEVPPDDDDDPIVPPDDGDPPDPDDDPPDEPDTPLFEFPLFEPMRAYFFEEEPTGLRVEFLGLGTAATYEQLHCYVGYADVSPLWYPDMDGDQTSDESFAVLSVEPGGVMTWNVAGLSGESMPVFYWPRNRDLPISVSCVGIVAGGTDSVELGRWEGSVSPERWTGVAIGGGVAGSYEFAFRITRLESWGGGIPLYPDISMTPPTNARLDERRISLRWDYNPLADEEAIDGFRVYLNDNLQWVEPADSRESMLPYEWFNPPCGTTYTFAVSAYRSGLPVGDESSLAITTLEQPAEDCEREVMVTFLTLETFDLGGDGRYEDRDGDVGPPHGYFYANEGQITFDGGTLESGGGVDRANGFRHNTTYNLNDLSADPTWGFNGMPVLVAAVPEGGTFEFGFSIMDEDSGRCRNSDDPGCDDLICDGASSVYYEERDSSLFDERHEGTIMSENGRCRVTYQWGPAAGSPVGSGEAGHEPLPQISLESMEVDEASGQVRLHVRNTGTASWPWRDLNVELQSRDGLSLGVYTWTGFILEPGQRTVLEQPDLRLAAPFDACVVIDPYDDVLEELERSAGIAHRPHCPSLPDLVIGDVDYEASGGGRLRVTVHNAGEGTLNNRTLALQSLLADGSRLYLDGWWLNVTLGPYESRTFDLSGVTESAYEQMRAGYSVIVNPERTIVESNYENNTFTTGTAVRVRFEPLEFFSGRAGENQLQCRTEVHFNISVGHGSTAEDVEWTEMRYPASGHLTFLVDHFICPGEDPGPWLSTGYFVEIEMPANENLYIRIEGWEEDSGASDDDLLGEIIRVYGPGDNYGEGEYGWTESTGGYNDDVEPNGGLGFVARWRIILVTP